MKVILLEDVKSLGKKGDLVEVSAGYARNFILPKKKGVEASSKNINDLKLLKTEIEKKELAISIKVGENGKAFGAISSKELAQADKDQFGLTVDKKKIVIDEPIKALGDHEVKIKLHPKVTAALKVKVSEK